MTTSLEELKFNSKDANWDVRARDNIYFLDTLSIKGVNANAGEPSNTFIAPHLRKIGLWVDGMCGELLKSYASLIQARRVEDPAYQGTNDFRVSLMLDENRPDLIHGIAPLLVMRGSRGEKLVDVELVGVN